MNNLYLFFAAALLVGSAQRLSAQTDSGQGYISSDRPDQSEGATIMAPRKIQFEWGGTYRKAGTNLSLMARYGIIKDWEVRLEGVTERLSKDGLKMDEVSLSSKLGLLSEEKWLPAMSLIGYLHYAPRGDREITSDLTLALEKGLNEHFGLASNIGSSEGFQKVFITGEVTYQPSERIGTFVEYYGSFASGSIPVQGFDLGVSYGFSRSFSLDLSYGVTYTSGQTEHYASLGGSIRL